MKLLITGGNGQLGTELTRLLDEANIDYITTDAKSMDITDEKIVNQIIQKIKPNIIYHCAAYTAVDKAEDEGKSLNQLINVDGTRYVAKAAEKIGATIVYISTDYVFEGNKKENYTVDDSPNPRNEYGRAKYEGELEIQKYASKYYIIRTSWVYGEFGANFVYTMQRLAKSNPVLTVVSDQLGRPTWTRNLAEFMLFITEKKADYGIYHFSNDETCSWYEFASEILKNTDTKIMPISSEEFPQKAKRPQHSILDLRKTKELGFKIDTWKVALENMLDSLK